MKWAFWGTPDIAETALRFFVERGFSPNLVITAPDRQRGRGLTLSPSPVKKFAQEHGIEVITPENLKDEFFKEKIKSEEWDFFLVFAYGKIMPEWILSLPIHGTLNIHPSLLPKFRGPSPIQGFLLSDDDTTGVSIMLLDREVDHGPIVAQVIVDLPETSTNQEAETILAEKGAELFLDTIEDYINGLIKIKEQDHDSATFTHKYTKEDACISLTDDPKDLWKKFRAFTPRPGLHFFVTKNGVPLRVKIKNATFKDGVFSISRVVPEGKSEIDFNQFMSSLEASS